MRIACLRPRLARRLALAMLVLAGLKPLVDFAERAPERFLVPPDAVVTALMPLLALAFLLVKRRWAAGPVVVAAAVAVPVTLGLIHAIAGSAPFSVLEETTKLIAGFSPLVLLRPRFEEPPLLDDRAFDLFFRFLVFATAVHVAFAGLQLLGVVETTYTQSAGGRTYGRPSGGYFHPMSFGFLLVFGVLFSHLRYRRGVMRMTRYVATVGIAFAAVAASTHRTSMLALLAVLLILHPLRWAWRESVRRPTLAGGVLLALVAAAALVVAPEGAGLGRITGVLSADDFDVTSEEFLRGRGERWIAVIEYMTTAPNEQRWFGAGHQVVDPHNDLLRAWLVSGVPGVIAIALAYLVLTVWSLARCGDDGRWVVLAGTAFVILFSVTFKPTSYPFFVWMLLLLHAFSGTPSSRGRTTCGERDRFRVRDPAAPRVGDRAGLPGS